jgi:ribosomal protein L24
MAQIPSPGDKVKITEGRHKGKIGLVSSVEQSSRGITIYEVKVPTKSNYEKLISGEYESDRKYVLFTKLTLNSIELLEEPVKKTEAWLGRRLLIIQERGNE